jgi:hypothetical protein
MQRLRSRKPRLTAAVIRCTDYATTSTRKSRHYFAGRDDRTLGTVRLRTKRQGVFLLFLFTVQTTGYEICRLPSSGMLRRVALVRADVSDESISSIIKVTRIGELGTTLAENSNCSTLQRNAIV